MSVAIIHWPVNDVGGIDSWCKNFQRGLNTLGIHNQLFYATAQTRFECDPNRELVKARYARLASRHLSYRSEQLAATLGVLNSYDLIVMLHPSPHPTRAVKANPDYELWKALYTDTAPPKLVVFHDMLWPKTNAWIADVADHVDAALAAQKLFIHALELYPSNCPKTWEYFPLIVRRKSEIVAWHDRSGIIMATQWLKWKNHHKLLPQLCKVRRVPVHLYGNGQEYYTLRKSGVLQEAVRKDLTTGEVHNRKSRHVFHGFAPYSEVLEELSGCVASLDCSTRGYTNMTHWEPLTVGTVSLIEKNVVDHPDNQIPHDCCVPYSLDDVATTLNRMLSSNRELLAVATRGCKFVKKAGCVEVTGRILDWLDKNGVVNRRSL